MNLNSLSFIMYFAIVILMMVALQIARKRIPAAKTAQKLFLLVLSYFFLFRTDWRFCVCIALVTSLTYALGLGLKKSRDSKILWAGTLLLVVILGYFKYANFFVNSFSVILGGDSVTLNIILPVGISFYIFSALSYLIDVYRGNCQAETFFNVALYLSFFPKITAGPIVRGTDFFPQVREYRGILWTAFNAGIQIFVFGLFKKVVLADHLGVFVDSVFNSPVAFNTGTVILATISYSLQIYFDFSGYSDMAIGVSKILGFDLKPNFNLPYIAQDVSEFWKRWHISLSSWLLDYLYIPLGGSRKGTARTYINLMAVMLISGFWHGAGWTFVAWGALYGIASCVNKAFGKYLKVLGAYVNGVITYTLVTLFWVVFRADSFDVALKIWTGMFTIHTGINQPCSWSFFAMVCLAISTVVAAKHNRKLGCVNNSGKRVLNGFYPVLDLTRFWSLVAFFFFCGLIIVLGCFRNTAFIYGAF